MPCKLPVVIFCQESSPSSVQETDSLPFVMHFTIQRNFCNIRKCFYILELLNCWNGWTILIAFSRQGKKKKRKENVLDCRINETGMWRSVSKTKNIFRESCCTCKFNTNTWAFNKWFAPTCKTCCFELQSLSSENCQRRHIQISHV